MPNGFGLVMTRKIFTKGRNESHFAVGLLYGTRLDKWALHQVHLEPIA
jgi:hypothetical protein